MITYLTQYKNIRKLAEEISISNNDLHPFSLSERNPLAEFINVLAEVRRVARQLEADRKMAMSRAPYLLRELYEKLMIISGNITSNPHVFFADESVVGTLADDYAEDTVTSFPSTPSTAQNCKDRDEARATLLRSGNANQLTVQVALCGKNRLGALCNPVSNAAALW